VTTLRDEARETGDGSHKFGDDRMAALLWLLSLEQGQDDETGNAIDWHYWVARFGRRLLYCLSSGRVYVECLASEDEARREMERIEEQYYADMVDVD
jgi:hypothetical protein